MKILIAAVLVAAASAGAQTAPPPPVARTPAALAALATQRFKSGSPDGFAAVFPDSGVRAMVRAAVVQGALRETGESKVLWQDAEHAVLFLSGSVRQKDSTAGGRGPARPGTREFAGLYEAVKTGDSWEIKRSLPVDSLNSIRSQDIHVDLHPGERLDIVDTLVVGVGARWGLATRMTNSVNVKDVRVDGRAVAHSFGAAPGGGILWIAAPVRKTATLVILYSVPDERRPVGRGGRGASAPVDSGAPAFGQHFNTDGWHPYLDINSPNDRARYTVTVRAPSEYRVTTSLPQTDTVVGSTRIVRGTSTHAQFLVSLLYDRYWRPQQTMVGNLKIETFFRPNAKISHDTAVAAFARVYKTFSARFGPPNDPPYLAVVESFGYGATSGCGQRQADLVMCGGGVTDSMTHPTRDNPSYTWAHETSHAWTMNADGPAATMLREGWATFAEATALGVEYPELESAFWERARNGVMLGTEGHQSLIPPGPTGGSYSKGGWLFHMLNYLLGDSAFDRAIRGYSRDQFDAKRSGYPELIAHMSAEAGSDLTSFTMPWLSGRFMPDLDGTVIGTKLIVTQRQPESVYDLPKLDVDLVTGTGTVRHTFHLTKAVDTVDVGDVGIVTGVRFDPDHHFLMQRHWGEIVRFELPASKAPNAKAVAITATGGQVSFSIAPFPAVHEGDVWVVTLPLSEGRYPWRWEVDGGARGGRGAPPAQADPSMSGVRVVKAVQQIGPYPR